MCLIECTYLNLFHLSKSKLCTKCMQILQHIYQWSLSQYFSMQRCLFYCSILTLWTTDVRKSHFFYAGLNCFSLLVIQCKRYPNEKFKDQVNWHLDIAIIIKIMREYTIVFSKEAQSAVGPEAKQPAANGRHLIHMRLPITDVHEKVSMMFFCCCFCFVFCARVCVCARARVGVRGCARLHVLFHY